MPSTSWQAKAKEQTGDVLANKGFGKPIQAPESASVSQVSLLSRLNYTKSLEILILLALPSIYVFYVAQYFSLLPCPCDPLQYLEPAIQHSLVGIFPWIDRVVVAIGLRLSDFIFSPTYIAGMYYIAIVNSLIVTVGVFWCYIKRGFAAGLLAGIILVSSYTLLTYATYIYADQTMALFALLAFVCFYSGYRSRWLDPKILAGVFVALTCFSKVVGIAILVPFAISIVSERKWGEIKKLVIGFLAGTLLVFFITYLLFGWDSIAYLPSGWVAYYGAAVGMTRYGIGLSYSDMIVSQYYLPIFFSMLILAGAYREKLTRNLYFAAISFLAFLVLAIAFTQQYRTVHNYLYPAVVFSSLGLAMYLGQLLKKKSTQLSTRLNFIFGNKAQLIYAIICLSCVFFALKIGIEHPSAFMNPSAEFVPGILRMVYPVVPLMIVGGLLLIEYSKSRIVILLFMILISLWSPAYNGAFAYNRVSHWKPWGDFYYEAAPILNEVPAKEFSVYVEDWNKHKDWTSFSASNVLWAYGAFFNEKYIKAPQSEASGEIRNSIHFISDKERISKAKGSQILTDNSEEVRHYFPHAQEIRTVPWEGGILTILDISQEGEDIQ